MRDLIKRLFLIIWGSVFALSPCGVVHGKSLDDILWQKFETRYTIIHYQSLGDLKKFNKKVNYSPGEWGLKRLFSGSGPGSLEDNIRKKVDALYERAQEILDMRKRSRKINIKIYPDKNQLRVAHRKVHKKSFRTYKASFLPRAWYIHEFRTIYLNANDLREGILAHEMAHSIIDNYLIVRPPTATAEILARYVDAHLLD